MIRKYGALITGIIALVWVFGLMVWYYAGHKPFDPAFALSLAMAVFRIVCVALLVFAGGGIGSLLYQFPGLGPASRCGLQALLGLGMLSLVYLGIGSAVGVRSVIGWLALVILIGINFRAVRRWFMVLKAGFQEISPSSRAETTLAVYIMTILALGLVTALAPPVRFDALVDHLSMPMTYLANGRVSYLPENMRSGMPQLTEMLYTWSASLGGIETAAVMGLSLAALGMFSLAGFVHQKLGNLAGWAAPALLISGSSLATSLASAYVDWTGLVYGLAVLVCLDTWNSSSNRRDLVAGGIFCGLAWGSKYTAGMLIPLGILAIILTRREKLAQIIGKIFIFTLAGLVLMLPWFYRNFLATGNPIYPLLFPSGAMDSIRLAVYHDIPPYGNLLDILLLPIRASIIGAEGTEGYSVSTGPLLLALGALAWLGWKERPELTKLLLRLGVIISAGGIVIWIIANQLSGFLIQTRYYFVLFPAFVILAAAGFEQVTRLNAGEIRWGRLIATLVGAVLILNAVEVIRTTFASGAPQVLLGTLSRQEYLEKNLGWYARAVEAVKALPEGSKTQLVIEPRSLYCLPGCMPDETLDKYISSYTRLGSSTAVLHEWKSAGVTHLLYYQAGAEFLVESGDIHHPKEVMEHLEEMLAQVPPPQDFGGVYSLYTLP